LGRAGLAGWVALALVGEACMRCFRGGEERGREWVPRAFGVDSGCNRGRQRGKHPPRRPRPHNSLGKVKRRSHGPFEIKVFELVFCFGFYFDFEVMLIVHLVAA
jgi:hypothetical protein